MMLTTFLLIIVFFGLALSAWRFLDHQADRAAMHRLMSMQPVQPARFDPGMTSDLPEPARRYFLYTIKPGKPLYRVAKISMSGRFGMGTRTRPGYLQMTATQILAMPAGFIWKMRARRGLMTISGSDSECWTRFWLMGLLPVARMGGNPDHIRSAFGRYVAEAVFWTPAATLRRVSLRISVIRRIPPAHARRSGEPLWYGSIFSVFCGGRDRGAFQMRTAISILCAAMLAACAVHHPPANHASLF
ncbi:MAG: hypothetical protein LC660_14615 [Desulfobacteraceae bacterium]|nr:hypothetical protein [Desulfobacteraceae bacterium]